MNLNAIHEEIKESMKIEIPRSILLRALKDLGSILNPIMTPVLREKHRTARLAFC